MLALNPPHLMLHDGLTSDRDNGGMGTSGMEIGGMEIGGMEANGMEASGMDS